jgi:hypothetical protein
MFIRAAKRLPDEGYVPLRYGRSLLSDQMEYVKWRERYFWVSPDSPTPLRNLRRDVRDTIAESLLATASHYLRGVHPHREESSYLRSWINFGLQWCLVCAEHEGGINLYTRLPELDVAAINGALDQDGGISAFRRVKQRQWAAFTVGCDPFQSTLLIHLQMLLPVSQNRRDCASLWKPSSGW